MSETIKSLRQTVTFLRGKEAASVKELKVDAARLEALADALEDRPVLLCDKKVLGNFHRAPAPYGDCVCGSCALARLLADEEATP